MGNAKSEGEEIEDPMGPARGCVLSVIIGALLWAGIIVALIKC